MGDKHSTYGPIWIVKDLFDLRIASYVHRCTSQHLPHHYVMYLFDVILIAFAFLDCARLYVQCIVSSYSKILCIVLMYSVRLAALA